MIMFRKLELDSDVKARAEAENYEVSRVIPRQLKHL